MGEYGDNIIINGSGPSDPKARKFVEQPPYSIGFKQEDGSYRYITFSRFDPLSGVLAMASDYAYYAQNSGDADMVSLENLFTSGVLAVAEYAMNMPFLQGVSELHNASFNPQGTSEKFFERMQQYFGQKIGGVITSGNDFINQFKNKIKFKYSKNLKNAILTIKNDIKKDKKKKTILFSPAAASFDQFKNFEHRGRYFNKLIKKASLYGK